MQEEKFETYENEEGLEHGSGFMSYEDLIESRKITLLDIKEHLTGPVISTIVHIVLLSFLGTIVVFEAPKEQKEITVEVKKLDPPEIEPPPPPPEPPEPVESDKADDQPIMTPDVDVEVDVTVDDISVDAPTEVDLPNVLNMKLSNSALKLSVPAMGRRKGGGGKIGGFGYGSKVTGDLEGVLYDLKTKPDGSARAPDYWNDVQNYVANGFNVSPGNPFRQIKKKLYNSHFYIPSMSASEGPKQFGAEKEMQPSAFFVHYKGKIRVPKEFRFAGSFDDMLVVFLDGKCVFDGSWGHDMPGYAPQDSTTYPGLIGWHEEFGNWVQAGAYKIDILIGERPGGVIGGALLIQEKDKTYPTADGGRPILPIFSTASLNKEEKARIEAEVWKIATDGPPLGVGGKIKVKKEKAVTGLKIQ